MVRISNPISSPIVFAATQAFLWSFPAVIFVEILQLPDPYILSGVYKFHGTFLADEINPDLKYADWSINMFYRLIFYSVILSPITFIIALKTIPKKLLFTEKGVTITFRSKSKTFSYSEIESISYLNNDNGPLFLQLKIGKKKYNLEVTQSQLTRINKYIPVY